MVAVTPNATAITAITAIPRTQSSPSVVAANSSSQPFAQTLLNSTNPTASIKGTKPLGFSTTNLERGSLVNIIV